MRGWRGCYGAEGVLRRLPLRRSTKASGGKSTRGAAILLLMASGVSVDEFQALEQKVLRAVEIVKREREARTAAEAEVASLREQLAAQSADLQSQVEAGQSEKQAALSQIEALNHERDVVRQRVERMLQQMDELL